MEEKAYYTMSEISRELGLTRQAIFWHIKMGRIPNPVLTIGNSACWNKKQVEKFLKDHRAGKYKHGPKPGGAKN